MNALFGLHLQISVGESLIVGTAVSHFGCVYYNHGIVYCTFDIVPTSSEK